jgi:hypothetical protein
MTFATVKPNFGSRGQILFCRDIVSCIDPKMVGNMADHLAEPASSRHAKKVGGVMVRFHFHDFCHGKAEFW